jgi:hypothetical protein
MRAYKANSPKNNRHKQAKNQNNQLKSTSKKMELVIIMEIFTSSIIIIVQVQHLLAAMASRTLIGVFKKFLSTFILSIEGKAVQVHQN